MRPTLRTVLLFLGGAPVALLCVLVDPRLWTMWLAVLAGSMVLVIFDVLLAIPKRRVTATIELPEMLYIGTSTSAAICIDTSGWKRRVKMDVAVDLDEHLVFQQMLQTTTGADHRERPSIELTPTRRGLATVQNLHLRWKGPLGLTSRQVCRHVEQEIPIVPNIRAVRAAAIRFFSRDSLFGMKVDKKRGEGSEFDALREYVPGMDHRAIDWKHSARHRKLVAKEFRSERNHPVVLTMDTGHLMSQPVDGIPKLDHAINSALLLAYIALRTGDRVSMFAFDERVRSTTRPEGGVRTFARIQRQSAKLAYQTCETNFTLGLAELATQLNRRSLIVLFSDFVDTTTAELMLENVQRLIRKHLVVFVAARDPALEDLVSIRPTSITDMHRSVVASNLIAERELVMQRLKRLGVHCLDVHPKDVSVFVVNRYLDIKRRELL